MCVHTYMYSPGNVAPEVINVCTEYSYLHLSVCPASAHAHGCMHVRPDKPALKPADTRSSDPSSNHAIPTWGPRAGKAKGNTALEREAFYPSMNERLGLLDPLVAKKPAQPLRKLAWPLGLWAFCSLGPPRPQRPLGDAPLVDQVDVPYGRLAPNPPFSPRFLLQRPSRVCRYSTPGPVAQWPSQVPVPVPNSSDKSRLVQSLPPPSGPSIPSTGPVVKYGCTMYTHRDEVGVHQVQVAAQSGPWPMFEPARLPRLSDMKLDRWWMDAKWDAGVLYLPRSLGSIEPMYLFVSFLTHCTARLLGTS